MTSSLEPNTSLIEGQNFEQRSSTKHKKTEEIKNQLFFEAATFIVTLWSIHRLYNSVVTAAELINTHNTNRFKFQGKTSRIDSKQKSPLTPYLVIEDRKNQTEIKYSILFSFLFRPTQ